MQNKKVHSWFKSYQQHALKLNERRLVVLVGNSAWASTLLTSIDVLNSKDEHKKQKTCLIYGENENLEKNLTPNVSKNRFSDKLGSESHFVIFQDNDLSIDALAALSGTLVAGGIFFLLIKESLQITKSFFYQRFFKQLHTFKQHVVIEQNHHVYPILDTDDIDEIVEKPQAQLTYNCLTQEQVTAVDAITKVLKGKRNQPLVLTADRGRGKSSALAIACAQLLNESTKENSLRIVITAADLGSLSVFFRQLTISLPAGQRQKELFTFKYGSVEFIAIDQLLKRKPVASLVLVDEAAAIPIYLLDVLLENYSRLVFSSTIHGYEGAGRGFTLKFQKSLTLKYPQCRTIHIQEPIRWRVNDPLEALVFDTCLLNAELTALSEKVKKSCSSKSSLLFKPFSAAELVQDEALLKQVVAVLVTAHYQTKPSDVRMLLDNEHTQLVCLLSTEENQPNANNKNHVVAVALLISEGSTNGSIIDAQDISAINHGQRRLKNHFVPQSLLTQCGIEQAFEYQYMRVMRIAVHPQLQQQGMGSYFLSKISEYSITQGADFLASSFGATSLLLSFWFKNDFQLARIGFTKDKASGEQSALVLKALSTPIKMILEDINSEFYRSFDYLLTEEYKRLSPALVLVILRHCPVKACATLSARDKANIEGFAQGYKQYSSCVFSLHLGLKHQLNNLNHFDTSSLSVLISRIMQKDSIADVCNKYGFTGKKDLEKFLRTQFLLFLTN